MEARTVCRYNKIGYCKYKDKCRNRHIEAICVDESCDGICEQRHPKVCRFYQQYGRCKFNPCMYSHGPSQILHLISKIETLEKELEIKELDICELKKLVAANIYRIRNLEDRMKVFVQTKDTTLKETIIEKT